MAQSRSPSAARKRKPSAGNMHLRALSGWLETYEAALKAGLAPNVANAYANGQWSGADPMQCRESGGMVHAQFTGPVGQNDWSKPNAHFTCLAPAYVPPPPAPPPAAAVNTTVQTAVSPQISPVFVQQDEPTGSAVTAGTAQTSPSPQSSTQSPQQSSAPQDNSLLTRLLEDMLNRPPPMPAPSYSGDPITDYATPPTVAPSPAPSIFSGNNMPWLLAAAAVGAIALTRGSKKETTVRHRRAKKKGAR